MSFYKHVITCEMQDLGPRIVGGRRSYADSQDVAESDVITKLDFIGGLGLSYRTLNAGEATWRKRNLYMLEVRTSGGLYGSARAANLYDGDGVTEPFNLVL